MRLLFLFLFLISFAFAKIGIVSSMSGNVDVLRNGSATKAKIGFELEEKDIVKTYDATSAQLLFDDETVITVGKNSEFKIEEYLFDNSAQSNVKFGASKGFFKAITGKIGKISPDKFKIETKNATIGIRGTHILADIADDMEKIACTKGAIYLDVKGSIYDVLEGQITEISSAGVPQAPRELLPNDLKTFENGLGLNVGLGNAIDSIKLAAGSLKPDEKELQAIFEKINQIKDDDLRVKALDMLEDNLNQQLDEYYANKYHKFYVDSLSGIDYGYYTLHEIIDQGNGSYAVDGKIFDSYIDAIEYAYPIEMFRDEGVDKTSEAVISEYMGGEGVESWEGKADEKKIVEYYGKTIGFVTHENGLVDVIEQNDDNQVHLIIDFANRRFNGFMSFNADTYYSTAITSIGKEVVTPSSFYTEDFYGFDGLESFKAYSMYSRYYGDNASLISMYYEILVDPQTDDERNILGMVVASAEDGKEITLGKLTVGIDDYFSWGYWSDKNFIAQGFENNSYGAWINPVDSIAETSKDVIESYIDSGLVATYFGDVIGTVHSLDGVNSLIQDGAIGLMFDFSNNTMEGVLQFVADDSLWSVGIGSGIIEGNTFTATSLGTLDGSDKQIYGDADRGAIAELNGKFYGEGAEAIAGGFNMLSTDGDIAIGAFHGIRE